MIMLGLMHRVDVALHEIFQALADPFRVRIVKLMLAANDELCLCELSEALEEPEYKLSRHVKVLKSSGLITSLRDGKWIYHSLVKDQSFLKALHKVLSLFPDSEGVMDSDFKNFQKRVALRKNGRCQVPSRMMSEEKKGLKA